MAGPAVVYCMEELCTARNSLTQILIHIDKKEVSILDLDCACPLGTRDHECYLPGTRQRVEAWVAEVAAATAETPACPELLQQDLIIVHDRAGAVKASVCSASRPVEIAVTVADTGGINTTAPVEGDEAAPAAQTIRPEEAREIKESMEHRESCLLYTSPSPRD